MLMLYATPDPSLAVTLTFCAKAVPLVTPVKLSEDALRFSVGTDCVIGVVTLRVTGTASGLLLALLEVTEMLPW
jgi:hypothetical protein